MTVKARFAPSPTGEIHLGNVRTALFNYLYAGARQGVFLLRIEDTDAERSRPGFVQALMDDLRWLGLDWQEGPEAGGDQAPYYQAQRLTIYEAYYQALAEAGAIYPCFCSEVQLSLARKAQRAAGRPPRYPGTCAHLSESEITEKLAAGTRPVLRFRVPGGQRIEFEDVVRATQRFDTDEIGDFIIRRSNGTPAFFFTNAIDDALMGVTHVLRGEDHLTNTPRQLLILKALALPAPAYGHLSLLVGDDGSPLSKRHGSRSVRALRDSGYLPGALLNYLARLGHRYDDGDGYLSIDALAQGFALERLGRAPARYDEAQLRHWQKEAVAAASDADLVRWYLGHAGTPARADYSEAQLLDFVGLVRDNIEMPGDIAEWLGRLGAGGLCPDPEARAVLRAAGADFFAAALEQLSSAPADFRSFAKAVGAAAGVKGKGLFMPLRVALTGVAHGPEMARVWDWLGPERCRARLQAALNDFKNGMYADA